MEVVYKIDPKNSSSVLRDMLDKACVAGIKNVTVYMPTYDGESYVNAVDGVTISGNHHFKYSTIEGVVVTKLTIENIKELLVIL